MHGSSETTPHLRPGTYPQGRLPPALQDTRTAARLGRRASSKPGLPPLPHPDVEAEVVRRLEEAGRTLLALRSRGTIPAGMGAAWPEVVHDTAEAYGYGTVGIAPATPDAAAITRMDEALGWVRLIPADRILHRRIVLLGMLQNPVTHRRIWSWRKLGRYLRCDHKAVQRWFDQGIGWIAAGI